MSGICGIFYRNGKPLRSETIQSMVAAMAWLGPDGNSSWHEGPVGLGHLMLRNTPESLHERHPVQGPGGDLTLVSTTRIDNREELLRALEIPRARWKQTPDSELCLQAYTKWGEDCPERIIGDWAFAVWDRREQKLILARDQHGVPGLFYYADDRLFAFASSVRGLLALKEIEARPNEAWLAQSLVLRAGAADATAFEGIRLLHGSSQISVTREAVRKRRYFFLEHCPEIRLGSDGEYLEAFRELFIECIRCRLRYLRPPAISLSGGLDSASIAAVCARLVAPNRLQAFTSIPIHPTGGLLPGGRHADETPFVEATARTAGNIDVNYLPCEDASPLAACLEASRLADSPLPVANFTWILELRRLAAEQGLGVVLTGFGGNASISWYGHTNVFDSGNWHRPLRLLRDFDSYRSSLGASILGALRTQIAAAVLSPEIRHRINGRRRKNFNPFPTSVVNPELSGRLKLREIIAAELDPPRWTSRSNTRDGRCDVLRPGQYSAPIRALIDSGWGLETVDPALDRRILEFCLGIPDRMYAARGRRRLLIRRAMEDHLPPIVLDNPTRELQSADVGHRLRLTLPELEDSLRRLETSGICRYYLDTSKMRRTLTDLASGRRLDSSLNQAAGKVLLKGLVFGEFLLSHFEVE